MLSYENNRALFTWLCEKFDIPTYLEGGLFATGGAKANAIIEAGYNLGYVARQTSDEGKLEEDALLWAYEKAISPLRTRQPVGRESHWEEDAYYGNAYIILRDKKELIFRVARELWVLFPEIYERFGGEYPDLEPANFFRSHTDSCVFQRIELVEKEVPPVR